MRAFLLLLPASLSALVLGAHFLRRDDLGLVVACLLLVGLLFVRRPWAARLVQLALGAGIVLMTMIANALLIENDLGVAGVHHTAGTYLIRSTHPCSITPSKVCLSSAREG